MPDVFLPYLSVSLCNSIFQINIFQNHPSGSVLEYRLGKGLVREVVPAYWLMNNFISFRVLRAVPCVQEAQWPGCEIRRKFMNTKSGSTEWPWSDWRFQLPSLALNKSAHVAEPVSPYMNFGCLCFVLPSLSASSPSELPPSSFPQILVLGVSGLSRGKHRASAPYQL